MDQIKKYKKFTPLDQQNLMKEYLISPLSMKEYTTLKGVGLSTFTRWGRETGFSLNKKRPQPSEVNSEVHFIKKDMTFMNLTPYFHLEDSITKESKSAKVHSPLSLEILLPNSFTVKVGAILEDQALRFIKGLL